MIGFASPPKIQSIHLNVFVHASKGRRVWKVAKTYNLPPSFQEAVKQYVFSNRITKQTALRDCNASNIFYGDENKKKKHFVNDTNEQLMQ